MLSEVPQQEEAQDHEKEYEHPDYEPPAVVTYRGEEILEMLGPAQACSFSHSVVLCT